MSIINAPSSCGTSQQIHHLYLRLVQLSGQIPCHPLYTPERRELGGLILPSTPGLVVAVSEALCDHPDLFKKAPTTGPALAERQRCATGWLVLSKLFQLLMVKANDNYLLTQGHAAKDAMTILNRAKAGDPDDPTHQPRLFALVGAYALVDEYHKQIQKDKAARKQARQDPGAEVKKPARRQPRGQNLQVALHRWEQLILTTLQKIHARGTPPAAPTGNPLHTAGKNCTASAKTRETCQPEPVAKAPGLCYTSDRLPKEGAMTKEQELIELIEKHNGPLHAPPPEASFQHTEDELLKGRDEVHAAASDMPAFSLESDDGKILAGLRYPGMGGVMDLLRMGLEDNPGFIPGAVGDPALWERVAALDRTTGRVVYCGQLLANGGEAGELTTAGALHGLCEGTSKKAADLIAAPETAEPARDALRSAFCEPFRLLTDQKARAAQQQKATQDRAQPLQDRISAAEEQAAMSRAIEGFLSTQGASS